MELFAKPGVGGIIEKNIDGFDCILIQERFKEGAGKENGLLEIPAGKVREFENVFDTLRREIWEETGLTVFQIEGESDSVIVKANGYKVINYIPFSCSQNLEGTYPIMVETFICKAKGELLEKSNETRNLRWISLIKLQELLEKDESSFYPMHVVTLKKYLKMKDRYK